MPPVGTHTTNKMLHRSCPWAKSWVADQCKRGLSWLSSLREKSGHPGESPTGVIRVREESSTHRSSKMLPKALKEGHIQAADPKVVVCKDGSKVLSFLLGHSFGPAEPGMGCASLCREVEAKEKGQSWWDWFGQSCSLRALNSSTSSQIHTNQITPPALSKCCYCLSRVWVDHSFTLQTPGIREVLSTLGNQEV